MTRVAIAARLGPVRPRLDVSTTVRYAHACSRRAAASNAKTRLRAGGWSDSADSSGDDELEVDVATTSGRNDGDNDRSRSAPSDDGLLEEALSSLRREQEGRPQEPASSASSSSSASSAAEVRRVVETAMLAAVAGLAYTISTLLQLEGYLSYVLPLPVVLSAMRSRPGDIATPVQCVVVVFLLLFILLGPVRAVTYVLVYGMLSIALGVSFKTGISWAVSVPVGACARLAGQWMYIVVTSWVTNENLLELLITNAHTLLDNMSAWTGGAGSGTSFNAVGITLVSMLGVNALFYTYMMTLLYTILLRSMGYEVKPLPKFLQRATATASAS